MSKKNVIIPTILLDDPIYGSSSTSNSGFNLSLNDFDIIPDTIFPVGQKVLTGIIVLLDTY
ncbi:MAG: hypothetical protein PQ612_09610 [Rickettsiales bacterium]|nr:hypothetical protein [Pseudomonadota bacterium]MDA0966050.1 hypothetical protein [Pseudomonadota bacterium]MDG4544232.1 hypothetical protein [Rickettsiales bacterium]MDG4546411.1 hypothetical protein [Rickettsiales bacterium]MDG4548556.1 hypothetical protein [Rickettsiales bacterium]